MNCTFYHCASLKKMRYSIFIKTLVDDYHQDYRIDLLLDWVQSYFQCCGTSVQDALLGDYPWNIWHRHPDYECDKKLKSRKYLQSMYLWIVLSTVYNVPPFCCRNLFDRNKAEYTLFYL